MADYYNENLYEDNNIDEYEEDEKEDEINYISMEYKLDEMMENIYEDVIVPYLTSICQQEILHDLDEYMVGRFINFFKFNSPYYSYVLNKIDNK